MVHSNLNDWYSGWGWFLWFGMIFLMFSSFGNWGYSYRIHRRYGNQFSKSAIDILNERYARGEIKHDEYVKMKFHLSEKGVSTSSTNRDLPTSTSSLKPTY